MSQMTPTPHTTNTTSMTNMTNTPAGGAAGRAGRDGRAAGAGPAGGAAGARAAGPTWWVVFGREFLDLWIGGRALTLLLLYSLLMGIHTYVFASNSELSLIPPKEMVYETLKTAIAVSIFIGLIIGADSLSGERERGTLEALLLTPTSRRQLVVGKFLAALSPWPFALAMTAPHMAVLAQGDEVFRQALLAGAVLGSLLVPAYVGVGMLVSFWSASNKVSYFASLGIYVLFLIPAQLPGRAQVGPMGKLLEWLNPMAATSSFLSKTLVNNHQWALGDYGYWLTSPVVFAALVLGLLFCFAGPGLRLEAGRPLRPRLGAGRATRMRAVGGGVAGVGVLALLAWLVGAAPAWAQQQAPGASLQMSVDTAYKIMNASDHILFNTTVTNTGAQKSPPVIVAMNIVNVGYAMGTAAVNTGTIVVDPEDWSPQRTQLVESLAPGESVTHQWRINAIWDGDYMVYLVALPAPGTPESTTTPVASSGVHLTVKPFTQLNPVGVVPYVAGGPVVMLAATLLVYWLRRRGIDAGGADEAERAPRELAPAG
jgi:ABC-2 type transport system permease protein